ncbi:MAG: NAD(P)H-dependent oxidoreductase [Deltaproteobacteria bacterium]|nr:NAD(P)H-dependent oxidoreductase [Deltaproteobacteria bacterium]MBW2414445.1 NAD(P)H-dependent oxidoreductase [Deltaproteobacteria bacterium]
MTSADTPRVLHVVGSPRGEASVSTRVARAFLDAYAQTRPGHEVTTLDVWTADLPRFDGDLAIAKLAPLVGETRTPQQEAGWARVERVVADFARHDKIVISAPMWNFGLPWELKHYIDLLVQPGLSFGMNEALEHVGLLADRPVQLVLTRSSPLPEGSPEDFQLPYLRHILGFIGLHDVRSLVVEGTTLRPAAREELVAKHCDRARAAAADF